MANSLFGYIWAKLVPLPYFSKLKKTLLKYAWRGIGQGCADKHNQFIPFSFLFGSSHSHYFCENSQGKSNHSHFFFHAAPRSSDLWFCFLPVVCGQPCCAFLRCKQLHFVLFCWHLDWIRLFLDLRLIRSRVPRYLDFCWAGWRCYHCSWLLLRSYCPPGAASRSITLQANSDEPAQGNWVDFAWSGRTELHYRTAMKSNNPSRGMVKYGKAKRHKGSHHMGLINLLQRGQRLLSLSRESLQESVFSLLSHLAHIC